MILALAIVLAGTPAHADTTTTVAVMPVAVYTAQANLQEASDADKAALATRTLYEALRGTPGVHMADSAALAAAMRSPQAVEAAAGHPCNVIVACVRAVATAVGAKYAVMAKVSKTSNLIWVLSGELIDATTGKFILDDSTELKGDPNTMVPAGVKIFATRVARAVRTPPAAG